MHRSAGVSRPSLVKWEYKIKEEEEKEEEEEERKKKVVC